MIECQIECKKVAAIVFVYVFASDGISKQNGGEEHSRNVIEALQFGRFFNL
jgi:hypothetical protein